jgi:hypothetical protein
VDRIPSLQGKVLTGGRVNVYSTLERLVPQPPSVVVPYVIDSDGSTAFFTITNRGNQPVSVNAELMDDTGKEDHVTAAIEIAPHDSEILWADDLTALAPHVSAQSLAARLTFGNAEVNTLRVMCFMREGDRVLAIPGYMSDKANADVPVILSIPHLNASFSSSSSVRINNWSENDAPVTITVRPDDSGVVDSNEVTPISAHTTGTYSVNEIASQFGITDGSFSAEFTVYGEADKIFAALCQLSGYGISIMPVYKNKTTTREILSFY